MAFNGALIKRKEQAREIIVKTGNLVLTTGLKT